MVNIYVRTIKRQKLSVRITEIETADNNVLS